MRLHSIPKSKGASRSAKRLGRGRSSGHGKTSGRGQTGSKSRSGYSVRPGFEGGQMPLYLRLPRRGFCNAMSRTEYATVNVGALAKIDATAIDRKVLVAAGLIRKNAGLIKILGDGEINQALTITADKFSSTARSKIEKAGGKAVEACKTTKEKT